jgi:hypothetical protein
MKTGIIFRFFYEIKLSNYNKLLHISNDYITISMKNAKIYALMI